MRWFGSQHKFWQHCISLPLPLEGFRDIIADTVTVNTLPVHSWATSSWHHHWWPCCHINLMCMWLFPSLLLCSCCEPHCTVLWVSLGRLGCCLMMAEMVANLSWIGKQLEGHQLNRRSLNKCHINYYLLRLSFATFIDIIFSFYLALA